jgi:hypothetical protein
MSSATPNQTPIEPQTRDDASVSPPDAAASVADEAPTQPESVAAAPKTDSRTAAGEDAQPTPAAPAAAEQIASEIADEASASPTPVAAVQETESRTVAAEASEPPPDSSSPAAAVTGAAEPSDPTPQPAVRQLVTDRVQRMANTRMDQRKLSRLLKAVVDHVNVNARLPRTISVGARDLLAETAATHLLRRGLKVQNLPNLLADAAERLPEVATRIADKDADSAARPSDRIVAAEVRSARKAGALAGLAPWG